MSSWLLRLRIVSVTCAKPDIRTVRKLCLSVNLVRTIAQDVKPRDRITHYCAYKYVRRKMRERRNARKADRSSQPVHDPRNPAMLPVPFRNHCGHGENTCRMAGGKTAAFSKHGHTAMEESVGVVARCWNCARPQPPADDLHHHFGDRTVRVSFAREQSGLLGVRALMR
jgi:hypothetical protein